MKRFRPENPHGNWTRRGAIAAAAGLAACSGSIAAAQSVQPHPLWPTEGPPVLRGAVIAQRRRRLEVDGDTFGGGAAVLPSYGRSDFDALAEAGANLVVMSFPELWTVKPPYRRDTAMTDILGEQLDAAMAAGLYSVVALRSGPGRSDFIFHREARDTWFPGNLIVESIWTHLDQQAAWGEMCVDVAKIVAGRTDIAGLNLMVEPEPNVSGKNKRGQPLGAWQPNQYAAEVSGQSDWRRISAEIAQKVRAASPDLPILISPPAFARTDFLSVMGKPPVYEHSSGITDANIFAGVGQIPCLHLGPAGGASDPKAGGGLHEKNEWVDVGWLPKVSRMYVMLAEAFLDGSQPTTT